MLPDILEIKPLTKPPQGVVTVPGSKSITNRALILAALAKGTCTLRGALWADDTVVMVDSLKRLGFKIEVKPSPAEECNRTIIVEGCGGEIPNKQAELYVGNAGTAARFLAALVSLGDGEYHLSGNDRMQQRPMEDLFVGLRTLGVEITPSNHLPATFRSHGRLRRGKVNVSARHSSQFASALMMIAPHAGLEVELAEPVRPHGYIEMTRAMMQSFRLDYVIEPDLSSASYFTAAAFLTGGTIEVAGSPLHSLQVDGQFPQFLPPPERVSRLSDLGDSVMTLAICALFGSHPVEIADAERMREQECDRISAMVTELQRVGAEVSESVRGFRVFPAKPNQLHGAEIETYDDHRMAMCFAVLGLKVPGIHIKNPGCVSKTFPNFFEKLEALRG